MGEAEIKSMEFIDVDYMEKQSDLTPKMRTILVDWIIDVHTRLRLANESLYLAVNIIDRFLSKKQVARKKLQLVGITALLIASKFEESYTPNVNTFIYMTDNAVRRDQVLAMEQLVLATLAFQLGNPQSIAFMRRYALVGAVSNRNRYLSFMLAELALQDYSLIKYRPSLVGATCVSLALKLVREPSWSDTLAHYSGYSEDDLRDCMRDVVAVLKRLNTSSQDAVKRKYSKDRYYEVARMLAHI
eukprot:gnl/Ergobibamus_cyprinoides/1477.p1 GENE.gnl/Ergobibamus_cyprinoides/1477~~gnl/Ergobibamus_cyprinoides/1477.p1  ORF type:complete len:244 (-),score=108.24 gnl/Ergobibamus_cyprinoides/1477:156-887(-)